LEAYYSRALCHRNREGREEREKKGLKRAMQAIRFREGKTERLPAVNRECFLKYTRLDFDASMKITPDNQ
jgi:hypothetical protein